MTHALERVRNAPRRQWRRVLAAAAVVAAAALGAVAALWMSRRSPPVVPFEARDWVLVTAFDNRTGESDLDGQTERALEFELAQSGFVNVVPRVRIDDALELLRQAPGMRVNAELGRQVAIRDEGVRAIVTGSLERRGVSYLLAAELVRPADGAVVARVSETASDAQAVGEAVPDSRRAFDPNWARDSRRFRRPQPKTRACRRPHCERGSCIWRRASSRATTSRPNAA